MKSKFKYLLNLFIVLSDILLINSCYILTVMVVNSILGKEELIVRSHHLMVYNLSWLGAAGFWGLYLNTTLQNAEATYKATIKATAAHVIGISACIYIVNIPNNNHQVWLFILMMTILLSTLLTISRFLFTIWDAYLHQHHHSHRCIGIIGHSATSRRMTKYFKSYPRKYYFIDLHQEINAPETFQGDDWHQYVLDSIEKADHLKVKELYLCLPVTKMQNAATYITEAESKYIRLRLVPDIEIDPNADLYVKMYHGFPVFSQELAPTVKMRSRAQKRFFDLAFSSLVIVLLLSWLYPILAIIIKWQSKGPVLFKQQRSGRNNIAFGCYKFRSMRVNDASDTKQASKNDDRITRIGKFIRRTSLDELPQFFNVFKGEMSVVGPRPHMLKHTEQYASIDSFMIRHAIKPGITGWAQINGLRGETKEDEQMEMRLEKDLEYLNKWTFMFDVRIVFLSVFVMFKSHKNAF